MEVLSVLLLHLKNSLLFRDLSVFSDYLYLYSSCGPMIPTCLAGWYTDSLSCQSLSPSLLSIAREPHLTPIGILHNIPEGFSSNTSNTLKTSVWKGSASIRMQAKVALHSSCAGYNDHIILIIKESCAFSLVVCLAIICCCVPRWGWYLATDGGKKWIANSCFIIFWWMKNQRP